MIRDREAFETPELAKRTLAASDRLRGVREIYGRYHDWDWQAALLADLMLGAMQFSGDSDGSLEMDIVRAERVAGVRVAGGTLPAERRRFPVRRVLRDRDEQPFFDFGLYGENA